MTDDIVDFDDLDSFDYGDLDDINPDDLDIENLERELGLVADDATKESVTAAKTSKDSTASKSQSVTPDKKKLEDKKGVDISSPTAAPTAAATAAAIPTPSSQQKQSASTTASPSNKPSPQASASLPQHQHKSMNGGGMPSSPSRKTGGGPRPNNNFQGVGGIMYHPMPPTNMAHLGQYPFAQGMMGMNMMMMPPPPFPTPFPQMGFPGGQKIHINPKFAVSRPDLFGANNNNNANPKAQQQRAQPVQDDSSNNALKRQRELIMEQQRKRRERRDAEAKTEPKNGVSNGSANNGSHYHHQERTSPVATTAALDRSHQQHSASTEKREITIKGMGTPKGISIKGAAAAAAVTTTPSPPQQQQYQPPHRRRLPDAQSLQRSDGPPLATATASTLLAGRPGVLNRITPRGTKRSSPPPSETKRPEPPVKKPAIPIQTAGKSSKLSIANVNTNVTKEDIMGLAKSIPGRIENVEIDKSAKKATITFGSPESAVIFRRQYNRSHLHGEVIVVTFCT